MIGIETFVRVLKVATSNNIDLNAFSHGQMISKMWVVDELNKLKLQNPTIFLLGGWYGVLGFLLFENATFPIKNIRSFDIDPGCCDVADDINRKYVIDNWRFKASTADMYALNYNETVYDTKIDENKMQPMHDVPDVIINTSCEHIPSIKDWLNLVPQGKLCVLQSTDAKAPDHMQRVESIEQFKQLSPLSEVIYSGFKFIEKANYTRYMIIGRK